MWIPLPPLAGLVITLILRIPALTGGATICRACRPWPFPLFRAGKTFMLTIVSMQLRPLRLNWYNHCSSLRQLPGRGRLAVAWTDVPWLAIVPGEDSCEADDWF